MRALEDALPITVGSYTLGELIGRGGMSEVYAAAHAVHGDAIALKVLRGHDATVEAAFVAEAAPARALVHPNVVRILDTGRDATSGAYYVAMERIAGEDLAARLRAGRLDEPAARALFAAIARGMHAVHARGLVHRDLKPANVMLRGDVPCIIDFGIAKDLRARSARSTGRQVGTPAFMAPEQLTGGVITPAVDVWALGVMLFEAVTGRLPFEGFAEGRAPQLFEAAPCASSLVAISPTLDRLIARCLERDPARRARSMDAIARELEGEADVEQERVTQDAGVLPAPTVQASARSSPRATPALPRPRRNQVLVASALAVAVVCGVAIGALSRADEGAPLDHPRAAASPTRMASRPAAESPSTPPVTAALTVDLRTRPSGARIWIAGKSAGTTPTRLDLAGPTAVELRRKGYRAARVQLDRRGTVDIALVPVKRATRSTTVSRETLD